jgi:hypothetical protein
MQWFRVTVYLAFLGVNLALFHGNLMVDSRLLPSAVGLLMGAILQWLAIERNQHVLHGVAILVFALGTALSLSQGGGRIEASAFRSFGSLFVIFGLMPFVAVGLNKDLDGA